MFNKLIAGGYEREFPWRHEEVDGNETMEACLLCHRMFPSRAAWAVHAFRIHGVRNRVRRLVGGSRCDACSKEYNNPTSLQHHLNHSKECYNKLIVAGKTYTEFLPGKNNTSEIPRNKYGVPPLPSEGPQEERLDRAEGEPPDAQDWGLMESLVEMLINLEEDTTLLQCIDSIKDVLPAVPQLPAGQFEVYCATALKSLRLEKTATQDGRWITAWWWRPSGFLLEDASFAGSLTRRSSSKPPMRRKSGTRPWDFCKKQTTTDTWRFPSYVPRFGAKELVFVHLFFRREERFRHSNVDGTFNSSFWIRSTYSFLLM